MDKVYIEQAARSLQIDIWKWRESMLTSIPELVAMLDPALAAQYLGVLYEERPSLGRFGFRGSQFEVAGALDRNARRILLSQVFPWDQRRFTAAHEIGHWILHPNEVSIHRDRPINGLTETFYSKPAKEREADYFAACFLIPRKLLIRVLEENFQTSLPFRFDDAAAFYLRPDDPGSLTWADTDSFDRGMALATARSYAGRHFTSLARTFQVSPSTIAIRLQESDLIAD